MRVALYRLCYLKCNPTTDTYYDTKLKSEAGPHRVIDSPDLFRGTPAKVILVARSLLRQPHKSCADEKIVYHVHVYSFSKITSHRNGFLLFVKNFATRFLTRSVHC
jgi:hypothetical protein